MLTRTYGVKDCGWCGEPFTASKSNQIYCKTECTRAASNKKIIERYHANKALRVDNGRVCDACGNKLSRYNDSDTCFPCQEGKKELRRVELLRKLGFEYIDE